MVTAQLSCYFLFLFLALQLLQDPPQVLSQHLQAPGLPKPVPLGAPKGAAPGQNLSPKAYGLQPKLNTPYQPFLCLHSKPNVVPVCAHQPQGRLPPSPATRSEDFNAALKQGDELLQLMNSNSSQESQFKSFGELARWGWQVTRIEYPRLGRFLPAPEYYTPFSVHFPFKGLSSAMKALGISSTSPPNVRRNANQQLWFETDDGVDKPPTGGIYHGVYNIQDGAIFVEAAFSPENEVGEDGNGAIPDLHYWADVTALIWANEAKIHKTDSKKLRYIIYHFVLNKQTEKLGRECLNLPARETLPHMPWPGVNLSMETDEGKVMVGTTLGKSVARLLLHHRQLLGHKTIKSATLLSRFVPGLPGFDLIWEISDV